MDDLLLFTPSKRSHMDKLEDLMDKTGTAVNKVKTLLKS